jgi:hypothetical protein
MPDEDDVGLVRREFRESLSMADEKARENERKAQELRDARTKAWLASDKCIYVKWYYKKQLTLCLIALPFAITGITIFLSLFSAHSTYHWYTKYILSGIFVGLACSLVTEGPSTEPLRATQTATTINEDNIFERKLGAQIFFRIRAFFAGLCLPPLLLPLLLTKFIVAIACCIRPTPIIRHWPS